MIVWWVVIIIAFSFAFLGMLLVSLCAANRIAELVERNAKLNKELDDVHYTLWHREREKELRPVKPYLGREDK